MSLTWKDTAATLVAGLVAFIAWASLRGWDLYAINNFRWAVAFIGLFGIAGCILGSPVDKPELQDPYVKVMSFLGVLAGISILTGIISGQKTFLISSAAIVLLMWAGGTLNHALK